MTQGQGRRLRDGGTVAVHRNAGLRKLCGCPRRGWAKCPHPWHFNFSWHGTAYRFSLSRYTGKEITDKTEADRIAEEIRRQIREDAFRGLPAAAITNESRGEDRPQVSFKMFARRFVERYSKDRGKASWQDDEYMVRRLGSFRTIEGRPLGETRLADRGFESARPQARLDWKKKIGPNDKGSTRLSPESEAAYRAINLHFHDLRHEGGSRLIEAGWPVHYVQHMLGHASLQQTSTYLNATLRGLHESMRNLDQSRPSCKPLASAPPAASGLFASRLPPKTGSPCCTDC